MSEALVLILVLVGSVVSFLTLLEVAVNSNVWWQWITRDADDKDYCSFWEWVPNFKRSPVHHWHDGVKGQQPRQRCCRCGFWRPVEKHPRCDEVDRDE